MYNCRLFLFSFLFIITQSSCQSNVLYVDFDKQLICSDNSKGISTLTIKGDSDSYEIEWLDLVKPAPLKLSIAPLTQGYIIRGRMDTVINKNLFKLQKNKIYDVERAGGDAGAFDIKVMTDENGRFIKDYTQK